MEPAVTVVIATRDRVASLDATLRRLRGAGAAEVVVVDNASSDGTAGAVRAHHPDVRVVELPRNLGAAARTVGARLARTPLVAFSDDDSWWDPGALGAAAAVLGADPEVAAVAGRVEVEPGLGTDPTSRAMAAGGLDVAWRQAAGGRRAVAGFLACAVVVDRARWLAAGGFDEHLGIGGEEELSALDLAAAGWRLAYAPEAVARHQPSPSRDPRRRRTGLARNAVVVALLRRDATAVARRAASAAAQAWRGEVLGGDLLAAGPLLAWAWRWRRPVPPAVLRRFAALGAR